MLGSCCCASLGDACKTDSKNSRLPYILTFVCFAIVAFILSLVGDDELVNLPFYSVALCSETCSRDGAIYRIGLCLVIFFSVHFFILCIPGTGRFHTFVFLIKLVLLTALVVWSFWWDSEPIERFRDYARWFSWFFIIIQAFMLINWAFDTHNAMMARVTGDDGQQAEPNVKYAYLGVCFVLIIGSFALIVLFFSEYTGSSCSNMKVILSITIVFSIVEILLSYYMEHGNGFVASVVMVYVTYLNFQALATNTSSTCENPTWSEDVPMYTGFVILIATLSYIGYETRLLSVEEREEVKRENADIESGEKSAAVAHNHPSMRKLNRFFHLNMTLGSFYVTMIMTKWGDDGTIDSRWYGESASTWLIASGEWVAMLVYLWVLMAPKMFTDREFGYTTYD